MVHHDVADLRRAKGLSVDKRRRQGFAVLDARLGLANPKLSGQVGNMVIVLLGLAGRRNRIIADGFTLFRSRLFARE